MIVCADTGFHAKKGDPKNGRTMPVISPCFETPVSSRARVSANRERQGINDLHARRRRTGRPRQFVVADQKQIVAQIEREQSLVNGNRALSHSYAQKGKDERNKLLGALQRSAEKFYRSRRAFDATRSGSALPTVAVLISWCPAWR